MCFEEITKCFESIDNPISVDPDGGPCVEIGQILTLNLLLKR
jgi:hypothetical protein